MKLTDLNMDCLENVLEYLVLIDLLNVADSTKRLRKAAELVFARRHESNQRNDEVVIKVDVKQISRDRKLSIYYNSIDIEDLKTALQLLRCFGGAVSCHFLTVVRNFGIQNQSKIDEKIFDYINKYCAEYLKHLQICGSGDDLVKYFNGPFPNLTCFGTSNSNFTKECCLNMLFPKMKCLNYDIRNDNSFFDVNMTHFPHLHVLHIYEFDQENNSIQNDTLIHFLQLNPQLKDLSIVQINPSCSDLNMDLIRHAVNSLQNIEIFCLALNPSTFFDNCKKNIHMKSVKDVYIDFASLDFELPTCLLLPFSFEKLERFVISFQDEPFFNNALIDQFYNFVNKHPSITDLKIGLGSISLDIIDWSRLARSLPLLVKIEIKFDKLSADEAIGLIAKFPTLKEFHFKLKGDYNSFRKLLGKQWQATCKRSQATYNQYVVSIEKICLRRKM